MADFTDRMSLGTKRINPSSMIPGSHGNAPQVGTASQRSPSSGLQIHKTPQPAPNRLQSLADQLNSAAAAKGAVPQSVQSQKTSPYATPRVEPFAQQASPKPETEHEPYPSWLPPIGTNLANFSQFADQDMSSIDPQKQAMLPSGDTKKKSFKQDDFNMLADVFKALAGQ